MAFGVGSKFSSVDVFPLHFDVRNHVCIIIISRVREATVWKTSAGEYDLMNIWVMYLQWFCTYYNYTGGT